jgi:hypothetical protein
MDSKIVSCESVPYLSAQKVIMKSKILSTVYEIKSSLL